MPKVNRFPRIFGEDGSTGEAFPGKRGSAESAGWRVETARVVRVSVSVYLGEAIW